MLRKSIKANLFPCWQPEGTSRSTSVPLVYKIKTPGRQTGRFCTFRKNLLLHSLFNSNSHGNGHTDHGVVTCAQEAHHFDVKSALRRLWACGAGTFGAGSPTFRKTRSTSQESCMLCFPSMGTSYHILCSRNKVF